MQAWNTEFNPHIFQSAANQVIDKSTILILDYTRQNVMRDNELLEYNTENPKEIKEP